MLKLLKRRAEQTPEPTGPLPLRQIQDGLLKQLHADDAGVIAAVETAISQAVHYNASDLHFEPWENEMCVRFRIDGILHDVAHLPKEFQERITGRLKVLAKLVVYQKDVPQDGSIGGEALACARAMRVCTFPTVYGEKTVMRVLGGDNRPLNLDELGFRPDIVQALRETISRPQGTLLLTGPSSSGKTTTIYALLREIMATRQPAAHIVTIEDPVEYRLGTIAQAQVNPHAGFTFQAALRAVLRQDPEVIMVGEIRDPETARTAIQAGLTGHLIISTIHSGTAAGVFTRLLDMGIEPFLIVSSVTGVLAQRLVRMNCPRCVAPHDPPALLLEQFGIEGPVEGFVRGTGCEACQGIGYRGRTAIGELLTLDECLTGLVLERSRTKALHEAALQSEMLTMQDHGVEKAGAGITTLEELKRVLAVPAV